jgi:arginine decarboxylase
MTDGFCLLDPIKVTITMPGMDVTGTFAQRGIPAQIVTMFLDEQRIEIEKTGDYILLVLFSIGMTKGKWGTLLDGLLGFKRAYDENTPLSDRAPEARAATQSATRARARRPLRRDARRPARGPDAGAARQRLRCAA